MKTPRVPPGVLYASRGRPNPAGAAAAGLYLLHGAPVAGPTREIIAGPGVDLPRALELPPGRPFRLLVLHFNDLHGRLADVDPHETRPVFSRIAGEIRRARERCAGQPDTGVLVFSGGDDLVGTAFAELMGCRPAGFRCHPAFRLYSAAGVDAGGVGNHDLDWGLGMLARAAQHDAAFPLLAANLYSTAGQGTGVFPAALFEAGGLRVGVIGLTTPAEIKHVVPGELTVGDPIAAVRHLLPALRPFCNVVIVLSHLGHSLAADSAIMAGAGDVELARSLPHGAVDLIVGGHTHSALNEQGLDAANCVNGIPIVQAGSRGAYLGEVQLTIERGGVAVTGARLHPVAGLPGDAGFEAAHVTPPARQVQRLLRRPIGAVAGHPDLDATRVREAFAAGELALANFVADAVVARCRAAGFPVDFGMIDASAVCDGLPQQGVLTFGDLFRLAPHADSIVLRRLAPAQLQALLDDNARRAGRPGEPLVERGFLHFSREVRYTLVPGPARARAHARGVTVGNAPLEELLVSRAEPFLVACSSFVRALAVRWEAAARAEGGEWFDLRALPVQQTGLALREELVAYVEDAGGVTAEAGLSCDGRLVVAVRG